MSIDEIAEQIEGRATEAHLQLQHKITGDVLTWATLLTDSLNELTEEEHAEIQDILSFEAEGVVEAHYLQTIERLYRLLYQKTRGCDHKTYKTIELGDNYIKECTNCGHQFK